ncbi:hypothetical protein Ancab_004997, partial [Ancistrocladus abbreviatus]
TNVGNYTQNSSFQKNLDLVIADLTYQSSHSAFYNSTAGQGLNQAYGLYYCRGDLSSVDCQQCVQTASTNILEKCPVEKEAIIWYEECTFRYANRSIFSTEEEYPWSWWFSVGNVSNPDQFLQVLSTTMLDLTKQAAYNNSQGFATGIANLTTSTKLYSLVQCTPDILGVPCDRCLQTVFRDMSSCCGTARIWTMIFRPSCQMRYDGAPFFVIQSSPPSPPSPPTTTPNGQPTPPPSPGKTITCIGRHVFSSP